MVVIIRNGVLDFHQTEMGKFTMNLPCIGTVGKMVQNDVKSLVHRFSFDGFKYYQRSARSTVAALCFRATFAASRTRSVRGRLVQRRADHFLDFRLVKGFDLFEPMGHRVELVAVFAEHLRRSIGGIVQYP